jgi:ketosteroid isomerase-like protein
MKRRTAMATGVSALAAGCASTAPAASREELVRQVTAAETAFAKTMADRDHAAFMAFVADDAVFLNGGQPLRGKAAIGEHWKRFYQGPSAPFSWRPDMVEVVRSGGLAQSIGPVSSPDGKVFARFYSTWRLEPDGRWRVVLDDGYSVRDCPAAQTAPGAS